MRKNHLDCDSGLKNGGTIMTRSSLFILLTLLLATTSGFAVQRTVLAEEFTGTW